MAAASLYQGQSIRATKLDGGVAELTFDRKEDAINKFDLRTLTELGEATEAIRKDGGIKGLLVTSAKDVFIVGADITEFGKNFQQPEEEIAKWSLQANQLFNGVEDLPFPSVTAINGVALGGGFELALACDIRIASTTAAMGLPETTLAIIPGGGGTQRLPRIAGEGRAKELIFTGRRISAGDALQYGIVHEVAAPDELRMRAQAVARAIASNGPVAVRAAKEAIVRGLAMPLEQGLALEQEMYGRTVPTKDRLEGLEAFREKRAPVYSGE